MQMKKVIAAVCSVIGITVPATSQAHFIDSVDENTPVILRHASELQNNNIFQQFCISIYFTYTICTCYAINLSQI